MRSQFFVTLNAPNVHLLLILKFDCSLWSVASSLLQYTILVVILVEPNIMEDFKKYLKQARESVNSGCTSTHIHLVLGNESVDLDSTISVILLAYFIQNSKLLNLPEKYFCVPVINISHDKFLIRTENCYVLKEIGINLDDLIYRDSINLDELVKKNVTSSLVDHHILSNSSKILQNTVIQILDHRPVDNSTNWDKKKVQVRIVPVGSCATLVADEILNNNSSLLTKELAYLLYQTIVFDTIALVPENGKATELDITVAEELENRYSFNVTRKELFDKLWAVHNDISNLTPKQLLEKDLKIIEHVFVPGLPMLVKDFLKLEGSYIAIKDFVAEHKADAIVLVGIDAKDKSVNRDMAVYCGENTALKDALINKFKNSQSLKGYDLTLEELDSGFNDIVLFKQNNTKLSRKQIIPLIKDCVLEGVNLNKGI